MKNLLATSFPLARPLSLLIGLTLAAGAWMARGQEPTDPPPTPAAAPGTLPAATAGPVRFTYVDAFVDSGEQPLGAYQFEFAAETGQVTVVGITGGEPAAYKVPPYYDTEAMAKQSRLILAAYSTDEKLPKGKTRVARINVMVSGDAKPQYAAKLMAAADAAGKSIPATVTLAPAIAPAGTAETAPLEGAKP